MKYFLLDEYMKLACLTMTIIFHGCSWKYSLLIQRVFKILSNMYDGAFMQIFLPKKLHHIWESPKYVCLSLLYQTIAATW